MLFYVLISKLINPPLFLNSLTALYKPCAIATRAWQHLFGECLAPGEQALREEEGWGGEKEPYPPPPAPRACLQARGMLYTPNVLRVQSRIRKGDTLIGCCVGGRVEKNAVWRV